MPVIAGKLFEEIRSTRAKVLRRRCGNYSAKLTWEHRRAQGHLRARISGRIGDSRPRSQWVWTDDFPAIALAERLAFRVVHRPGPMQELLDIAARASRGVEEHDAAGLAAAVLPSVRDVARKEGAGAETTDADLVADLEGDLAGEHPRDLVAVAMEMKETLGAGGNGLLEQHDALVRLAAEQLQGG